MRQFYYPTSEVSDPSRLEAFHTRVRLSGNREGLLVDLGAHDNLTGSEWVERVGAWLSKHHPKERVQTSKLGRTISIEGVGTNPDRCENAVRVPLHMADGESATFDAPVIPNSSVPALLGMRSLAAKRAVVDVSAKTLTFPGPGQVQMILPPGSRTYNLEVTPTGHLLLPVTELLKQQQPGTDT